MSWVQIPSPTPITFGPSFRRSFLGCVNFPRCRIRVFLFTESHHMSIYWIIFDTVRLGIMPRPRGNDRLPQDIHLLQQDGVDVLVSALTAAEAEELGLIAEADECAKNGLLFLSCPIEDRSLPAHPAEFEDFIDQIVQYLRNSKSVVVHCRAGIGRSSLIAACALVKLGLSPNAAFHAIGQSRGCTVPDTPEQQQWVQGFFSRMELQGR